MAGNTLDQGGMLLDQVLVQLGLIGGIDGDSAHHFTSNTDCPVKADQENIVQRQVGLIRP